MNHDDRLTANDFGRVGHHPLAQMTADPAEVVVAGSPLTGFGSARTVAPRPG